MVDYTICLGTLGSGSWVSDDGGDTWKLSTLEIDSAERTVRSLRASEINSGALWASSESDRLGDLLHFSSDGGRTFHLVDAPIGERQITCIAPSPYDPEFLLLGTCPGGVLRSRDAGMTWEELPFRCTDLALDMTAPRQRQRVDRQQILRFAFTDVPGEMWAAVEIGGLWHTEDYGDSWVNVALSGGERLLAPDEVWSDQRHLDIHDVIATSWAGRTFVSVATPIGFFQTEDAGATWRSCRYASESGFDPSVFYTRVLLAPPGSDSEVLAGVSPLPMNHGTMGGIVRSEDGGRTWRAASPVLRSVVWGMSSHPQVPGVVAATTLYGQVLLSSNSGRTWGPVAREFGEIRSVAIAPTSRSD